MDFCCRSYSISSLSLLNLMRSCERMVEGKNLRRAGCKVPTTVLSSCESCRIYDVFKSELFQMAVSSSRLVDCLLMLATTGLALDLKESFSLAARLVREFTTPVRCIYYV